MSRSSCVEIGANGKCPRFQGIAGTSEDLDGIRGSGSVDRIMLSECMASGGKASAWAAEVAAALTAKLPRASAMASVMSLMRRGRCFIDLSFREALC